MPGATIQLCGRLIVELEGRRIDPALPGRQGRMLFAFLVLNRDHPVSRSDLVDALWAREPPRAPTDALAAVLSKVRAVVGDEVLRGRSNVELHLPADAEVDVERAISAVHDAESACALQDWQRAWASSATGRIVAHRTLLPEFEATWIDERRGRLGDVLTRSLECYARACLGIGGTETAAGERTARLLVRSAPLHETGHLLLMNALAAQGNVAEALKAYGDLRVLLRDELGVPPSEAVQRAYLGLIGAASNERTQR